MPFDPKSLFSISYGLYVVTCREGDRDNGLIVNTVTQVTDSPARVAVTINKENFSHDMIKRTGTMAVNCLSESAPFSLFERFGFHSGRETDKFAHLTPARTGSGLPLLTEHINAWITLRVEQYVDLDTHGMFVCAVEDGQTVSDAPSMTYTYYHAHVKPQPDTAKKKGWVCRICGWVYEGEELPPDIVCPLCKHGAADFDPLS